MKSYSRPIKVAVLAIIIALSITGLAKLISSISQAAQEDEKSWRVKKMGLKRLGGKPKKSETGVESDYVIEDQIPSHLPIAVKIENLKGSILREIEVKVTNTGTKPIYYVELGLVLPDVLSQAGYPISFALRYGRAELIKIDTPLQVSDVPVQPGDTIVLKASEENVAAFERLAAKGKLSQPEVKKIYLVFRHLTFGDKTGYSTTGGVPFPRTSNKKSHDGCADPRQLNTIDAGFPDDGSSNNRQVSFSKTRFFSGKAPPQSNLCCPASPPATPCSFFKPDTYNCQ